jgi:hypothetical protein
MATSGEFIASSLTLEYENPALTWNDITTYTNQGKASQSVGEAETTSYGTTSRTYIPGLTENTYSFTLMHNNTNGYTTRPQTVLWSAFNNSTSVNWRIRPNGAATGRHEITFTGFVAKFDTDYSSDDQVVSSDVEVRISGAVTHAAQS